MISSEHQTFMFGDDAVFIASSVAGACRCGRASFLFINRNGSTHCLFCDDKRFVSAAELQTISKCYIRQVLAAIADLPAGDDAFCPYCRGSKSSPLELWGSPLDGLICQHPFHAEIKVDLEEEVEAGRWGVSGYPKDGEKLYRQVRSEQKRLMVAASELPTGDDGPDAQQSFKNAIV